TGLTATNTTLPLRATGGAPFSSDTFPLRFVRRSRKVCCVSVVQEKWPLELVPKIGVGIMGVHGNKMKPMYHTGKNGVKAGKTLTEGVWTWLR
ncbi:MAG TPA: hypothetical protein VLL05_14580, partial [Terriglobales bacterium]|nr:hypothetical protein [Terriglobales bacterium]